MSLTEIQRSALAVARGAIEGRASAYGLADAVVFALSAADLLITAEDAEELERLRQERADTTAALADAAEERGRLAARVAELTPYDDLHPQECENKQHQGWFAMADGPLPCPWCQLAEAEDRAARLAAPGGDGEVLRLRYRIADLEAAGRKRDRDEIRMILRAAIGDAEERAPVDHDRAAELRQELADREADWAAQDADVMDRAVTAGLTAGELLRLPKAAYYCGRPGCGHGDSVHGPFCFAAGCACGDWMWAARTGGQG